MTALRSAATFLLRCISCGMLAACAAASNAEQDAAQGTGLEAGGADAGGKLGEPQRPLAAGAPLRRPLDLLQPTRRSRGSSGIYTLKVHNGDSAGQREKE